MHELHGEVEEKRFRWVVRFEDLDRSSCVEVLDMVEGGGRVVKVHSNSIVDFLVKK